MICPLSKSDRLHEIDGLRGWASLSVMLSHLLFGVFGSLEPALLMPEIKMILEPFLNGTFGVAIFFVLSGDALSASYWAQETPEVVVRLAVKRYFRLGIPIFVSCLIVFAIIKCELAFNREASSILHTEDWLGILLQHKYEWDNLILYSCCDIYFSDSPKFALNPFLWTMQIEMIGSLIVFWYLLSDRFIHQKFGVLAFIFLISLGAGSLIACFPFGVLCGYIRSRDGFAVLRRRSGWQILPPLCAFAILVFSVYCNHIWQDWSPPVVIASCAFVFCVYASTMLCRFLSLPFSCWLGRISFSLYLMHFPIIVSFTAGLVVLSHRQGVLSQPVIWLIALASAFVSLLAAMLFQPIEKLTMTFGDLACRLVLPSDNKKRGARSCYSISGQHKD